MKRAIVALSLSSLMIAASGPAIAAPKHPICADIGPSFGVGVSHFSSAGNWEETASTQYGAKWKYLYWYLLPSTDPPAAVDSWIKSNIQLSKSINAIPVFTFYELLKISQAQGIGGSEPQAVQQGLQSASVMTAYYNNFITLMKTLSTANTPVIVQVEPDSWGFMIWAMGVNGNNNATSIPVKVASSGHPDVSGFANHAGGLGHALLKLRDQYAPAVRLGWHVSNFRGGQGGDIVAQFYSSMGEWDALFSEHPHVEGDTKQWWLPWDEAKVMQNLSFFSTVTSAAHLPILIWQEQLGSTDQHLLSSDPTMRARFAQAGVAGLLFSVSGQGNPDDFRAGEEPDLAIPPPAGSNAGGTAKDMRVRVSAYTLNPLAWPAGFVCNGGGGSGSSSSSGGTSGSSSGAGTSGSTGSGSSSGSTGSSSSGGGGHPCGNGLMQDGEALQGEQSCGGCSYGGEGPGKSGAPWLAAVVLGALASLGWRRRRA